MLKTIALLAFTVALFSCNNSDKSNAPKETTPTVVPTPVRDSLLITDTSWGLITAKMDLAALQSTFGNSNLVDRRVCGPECADSLDVTILYPDRPKEVTIHWKDSAYHQQIEFVECFGENPPYKTIDGVRIGSTMADLLRINGQKITFSGFGWDYGGFIQSFNKGKLDRPTIAYRLDLMEGNDDTMYGERELNTDLPNVRKWIDKIRVYYLSLAFNAE